MIIKEEKGSLYITSVISGSLKKKTAIYYNKFLVKWRDKSGGIIDIGSLRIPRELIGKRLRFKVEVLENVFGEDKVVDEIYSLEDNNS